ncbi:dirigent protein 2-like [Ziziphus jujuba]|uniref:Dirigent protein n=1 Tax=Ziziphus jujuba TaxID=326968 RepID=A0A6P4BQ99_ZIZJJ|nr:dirigent protein 2-like [Ziziphus jujuba]
MANNTLSSLLPILLASSTLFFFTTLSTAKTHDRFSKTLSPQKLGLNKQKLTHLHFYLHDTLSGKNPTAIKVAEAKTTNTSSTGFRTVVVMDDPLTEGPEPSSKLVGRAQGLYALASQNEIGLLLVFNYVFIKGEYNGSTLGILGRNAVFSTVSKVREFPIVGGTGIFRFARGYAQARIHKVDPKTGDAVLEHSVYAFHY